MAYDPTEEGDALTAASILGAITSVADALNDLQADDLARRRFGHRHTPDLLDPYGLFSGFTAGSDDALVAVERYDNTIPFGTPSGGIENYLELFAPSGPYGPYTRPAGVGNVAEEGWLIPRSSGAPAGMEVGLATATDMAQHNLKGVRATGWWDLRDLRDDGQTQDPQTNLSGRLGEWCVYVGLGIVDTAGTRHVIERTIRRGSSIAVRFGPMSTATIIRPADLTAGTLNGELAGVFGAVISGLWDAGQNQHGSVEVELKQFSLVVEPIRAGDLE